MADERDQAAPAKGGTPSGSDRPVVTENWARRGRKTCPRCHRQLLIADFDHSSLTHDGYEPWCRRCMNQAEGRGSPASGSGMSPGWVIAAIVLIVVLVLVAFGVMTLMGLAGLNEGYLGRDPTSGLSLPISGSDCAATRGGAAPPPTNADLQFCTLSNADLSGVKLVDANMVGVALDGANLTDADLTGAQISSANLTNVIWSNTTCPDGTNSNSHGNTCVGYGI